MHDLTLLFRKHSTWPRVQKIISVLHKQGAEAYLAGGCVRDALLGRVPKDFDIASSARPEEVLSYFPGSKKQGKAFGVVFIPQGRVEVATFRIDGPYTDGRRPDYVRFSSAKEDALRRDFTVNALFYDLKTNKIMDYVEGLKDIEQKVIRTVGEPEKRFKEDHLRILRAIRFQLHLGWTIEKNTWQALLKMKESLLKISRERIYEECLKSLKTGKITEARKSFEHLNLLNCFLFPKSQQTTTTSPKANTTSQQTTTLSQQTTTLSQKENLKENTLFSSSMGVSEKEAELDEPAMKAGEKKSELDEPSMKTGEKKSELDEPAYSLWLKLFYPFLIADPDYFLTSEGKWQLDFYRNLKEWRFPVSLLKQMNRVFYASCCILEITKAPLGKKLRMLNSEEAKEILSLCRSYLTSKKLNTSPVDKMEKEFVDRATEGKLPPPLVNGHDLKSLNIPEDDQRSELLDHLYNIQLEQRITNKDTLLKHI